MLQGHIDVRNDRSRPAFLQFKESGKVFVPKKRIRVKDANPIELIARFQRFQEAFQVGSAVEVGAPKSRFLRDQREFAHALIGETTRFVENRFIRLADESSANMRYRAVGAKTVAAVRDLKVGDVRERQSFARRIVERKIALRMMVNVRRARGGDLRRRKNVERASDWRLRRRGNVGRGLRRRGAGEKFRDDLAETTLVKGTDPRVRFRIFLRERLALRCDRAACDDEKANRARAFLLQRLLNKLFRFFNCGTQKTARIEHKQIDCVRVDVQTHAEPLQLSRHRF